MGVRQALIHDWRERLDASEIQAQSAAPRAAWLYRARARIYRLLLAMYGRGDWRADCDRGAPAEFHAVPLEPGKPLKSLSDIRQTLKAVRSAVDAPPKGDYAEAASEEFASATIVFSSNNRSELKSVCSAFRVRGIDHSLHNGHILVRETDRERALAALASDRRRQKDFRNRQLSQSNDSARKSLLILLSLLVGSAIGFIVLPALRSNRDWQLGEIAAAYFALSMAWVGAILCLYVGRRRH